MSGNDRKLITKVLFRIRATAKMVSMIYRKALYRALGAQIGNNVKLGNIYLPIPEQVIISDDCVIEDNVRLRAGGAWKMSIINIGEETFIGHSTQINVGSHFKIGKQCMIAPMCVFSDAHHTFDDMDIPIKHQKCIYTPIVVEDDVWIGAGVKVVGGVTISKGAVIASGAVVNRDIPAYEIWGGVPAKKLKSRI